MAASGEDNQDIGGETGATPESAGDELADAVEASLVCRHPEDRGEDQPDDDEPGVS